MVRLRWNELKFDVCRTANALLDYDDEPCHEHHLDLGLRFFHTWIFASHEDQMGLLRWRADTSYSCLSNALYQTENPMYGLWIHQDTFSFHKDDCKDGPNAAWPWSTGNKVEIRYNQPDTAGLRKWGYVMWDKERLDQWTILQKDPHDF